MISAGIRSIARNTAYIAGAQAIGVAARLVYVVLVARLLGPDLYALLAYSQAWYLAFLPIALFGLGTTIVHAISTERTRAADIAAQALGLRIITTLVAVGAALVSSWYLAADPRAFGIVAILVVALAGRALSFWAQHLYTAYEVNHHALLQEALFRVLEMLAAIAILTSGGAVLELAIAQAAIWILQTLWSLRVVTKRIMPVRVDWRVREWRPLVRLAWPFFLIALAVDWRTYGPLVLFRDASGDAVLFGQFALAMQAVFILVTVPQALAAAAQPVITRSAVREDGKDARYASGVQRAVIVLGSGIALSGMALGPPVFHWLFGPAFAPAGELVGWSLWCLVVIGLGVAYPPVLIARGRLRESVAWSLLGAAAMTLCLPWLARVAGAYGAIFATAIGFLVPVAGLYISAVRLGLAEPLESLARPAFVAGLGITVYALLAPVALAGALPAALVTLAGGSVLLGVIAPGERQILRTWWQGRGASA